MLEWLESPEVVKGSILRLSLFVLKVSKKKELIKFDSSKMTIFAGRLENYHFLFTELAARLPAISYLDPYVNVCKERYEKVFVSFVVVFFLVSCDFVAESGGVCGICV
jgi:hypothetical protein